eukprot:14434663-Alexandrium_andersonii.AAC.1
MGVSDFSRRGEGRLARWACWDRRPLGLDFGPRAHFDRRAKWPSRRSYPWTSEHATSLQAFEP